MHFSLPASYSAYATRQEVRAAVDHILNSKHLHVPHDLDWNQLPDFHAAVLAAHQVRCDYASALCGLWDEVWQKALNSSDLELAPLSIAETQEWSGFALDTQSVWASKWLCRNFRKKDFYICLGVWLEIKEARLGLWFGDEEGTSETPSLLSAMTGDWSCELEDQGDEFFYTRAGVARLCGDRVELDRELDRLNFVARRALEKIVERTAA